MRYPLTIAALAATLGLTAGVVIGWRTAERPVTPQMPEAKGELGQSPLPKPDLTPIVKQAEGHTVPLAEIYSTVGPQSLKSFYADHYADAQRQMNELYKRLKTYQVPTAFIVRSFTIQGALAETLDVFTKRVEVTSVSQTGDEGSVPLWAFVYLGTQPDPPFWHVKTVRQLKSELIFTYQRVRFELTASTASVPHCYWVPLRKTESGNFQIRLMDQGAGKRGSALEQFKVNTLLYE